MSDLTSRLAEVLARHNATLDGLASAPPTTGRLAGRVLLPADEQRGPTPPMIGQPGSSARSCST
ncbi:hypothetical protein [Mycobacterium sp.]|uniref:hypothetical protein n=1 Tax=Mycobacterium sp. TaxID=1785 RepID=UPI001275C0DA|nr:hypothetical protein [Mycobacterium sp.]KAA8965275.1 MAG: hypothetical protein F6Q13_08595 [Mycobacterium sp.]